MVHALAGGGLDGVDDRGRAPCVVRARPLHVPRPKCRHGSGDRAVRPPDGRGARSRFSPYFPKVERGWIGDPDRSRLLQRRGRRPCRRSVLGRPRPARLRSGCDARRESRSQRFREVTLPLLAPALAVRGLDRVHVLVHVVRRSSSSSAALATRPSRRRSTTRLCGMFDLRAAAVLALVQLVCVALAIWVATRLERKLALGGQRTSERDVLRRLRTRRREGSRRGQPRIAGASSSASRSPSWSSVRSLSETVTAWRRIVRSAGRPTRCSRRPGRQC